MLVVIINHEQHDNTVKLRNQFRDIGTVFCIDSGSRLTESQRKIYDICLPNLYYTGLYNSAAKLSLEMSQPLLLVASDVVIRSPKKLYEYAAEAMHDETIGLYGPSSTGAYRFTSMNLKTSGLREVSFVDGYCFAVKPSIIQHLFPVSQSNRYGWGIEFYQSYICRKLGFRAVIDDRICVHHKIGSSSNNEEMQCMLKWFDTLPEAGLLEAYRKNFIESMPPDKVAMFEKKQLYWRRVERIRRLIYRCFKFKL